jgi:hypothetical protein
MKIFTVASVLSLITLNGVAIAASNDISPLGLFFAGYRGELTEQGISKYNSFCWDWKTHRMSSASLAKAGVEAGLLSQEKSQEEGYLNQVTWSIEDTCGYN